MGDDLWIGVNESAYYKVLSVARPFLILIVVVVHQRKRAEGRKGEIVCVEFKKKGAGVHSS